MFLISQRCLNKKKTLQADRFERLDRIGFTWVCRQGKTAEAPRRSGLDELWETRLKELEVRKNCDMQIA